MSGIRIFNAAISQLQQQQGNLRKVNAAKEKTKQDRETFNLDKKTKQLELEKARREGKQSEITLQVYKSQMDNYFKSKETQIKGVEETQNQKQHGSMGNIGKYKDFIEKYAENEKVQNREMIYDKSSNMFIFKDKKEKKVTREEEVLGTIENEEYIDGDKAIAVNTREDAVKRANIKKWDWQKNNPKIRKAIDRKFGPDVKEYKKIQRENNLTTPDMDLAYLVNVVGMERIKAIEWIRNNLGNKNKNGNNKK